MNALQEDQLLRRPLFFQGKDLHIGFVRIQGTAKGVVFSASAVLICGRRPRLVTLACMGA
jgi:hypothetical protein